MDYFIKNSNFNFDIIISKYDRINQWTCNPTSLNWNENHIMKNILDISNIYIFLLQKSIINEKYNSILNKH